MTDDRLLDYVLNQLDSPERAVVEDRLARDPGLAARVARLRLALRPLEADRDGFSPPLGLAAATVARVAAHKVAHRSADPAVEPKVVRPSSLSQADIEPIFLGGGWRRFDVAVAAAVAFLAVGLIFAGIGKVRHEKHVLACQNQLRELHAALDRYADTHGGRFPEVGTPETPTAGAFVEALHRAEQFPTATVGCPVAAAEPFDSEADRSLASTRVGYAYTLGYLGAHGDVVGVRRASAVGGATELAPLIADLPAVRTAHAVGPHGRGQNVLYAGGHVRFTTTVAAGINGDDIYQNDAGLVRAGLHRNDASLGRPADRP